MWCVPFKPENVDVRLFKSKLVIVQNSEKCPNVSERNFNNFLFKSSSGYIATQQQDTLAHKLF